MFSMNPLPYIESLTVSTSLLAKDKRISKGTVKPPVDCVSLALGSDFAVYISFYSVLELPSIQGSCRVKHTRELPAWSRIFRP